MPSVSPTRAATALAATLASAAALAPGSAHAAPATRVVARGLNAPKYLTLGPGGLYVAESGRGGHDCVTGVANVSVTRVCAGATGSIVRIAPRGRHRVTTLERHLASASVASTHGVSGVTAVGFRSKRMAVLFDDGGVTATGESAIAPPFGDSFGKLDVTARPRSGALREAANVARFAARHPQPPATLGGLPGETLYDSDPHDMVAYRGGFAIADAAADDVVWVHRSGRVTLIARLPTHTETAPAGTLGPGSPATTIRAQAVPSSVAVGPRGALYVGELVGVPSLAGTAEVDRVAPGRPPVPVVTGLTRVSDIAFDPRGRLDILESNTAGGGVTPTSTGALLRATLPATGETTATDLRVPGLSAPVGLAVSRSGIAYVTDDTTAPGRADVLAITGL